ncbi:unnamed protein product [Protopolystoma xenopodis]|uniref:Uncharacterized protein n=1 Tax=Protopolystoma xenopodis TaxID=117903 RepID=A0A448WX90_9PLAT|nr:unnamed protein product [Protopolystoma xenopodis]
MSNDSWVLTATYCGKSKRPEVGNFSVKSHEHRPPRQSECGSAVVELGIELTEDTSTASSSGGKPTATVKSTTEAIISEDDDTICDLLKVAALGEDLETAEEAISALSEDSIFVPSERPVFSWPASEVASTTSSCEATAKTETERAAFRQSRCSRTDSELSSSVHRMIHCTGRADNNANLFNPIPRELFPISQDQFVSLLTVNLFKSTFTFFLHDLLKRVFLVSLRATGDL